MQSRYPSLDHLQEVMAIRFANRALLQQAFVHRSYLHEAGEENNLLDNQRLEFLGDAVLSFVTSELLFKLYPEHREGELTNLRSALVKRETLARFARELQLGDYLLLGRGEEESGGRNRHTTLCDTYEALLGALYLDQGITTVRKFLVTRLIAENERVAHLAIAKDPKSRLQEWVQAAMGHTPRYRTVHTEGPDHARLFIRQVTIGKQPYGVGQGQTKQEAEQAAAAMALFRFGQAAPGYEDTGLARQYQLAPAQIENSLREE